VVVTTRPSQARTRPNRPNPTDVVFRLGTAVFGAWVVVVVATSPTMNQRPSWWVGIVLAGAVIAGAMLVGAIMTLGFWLWRR
jgi:hypothetical protein